MAAGSALVIQLGVHMLHAMQALPEVHETKVRQHEPVTDTLERYFSGLQQFPLLDAQHEVALAREIERLELEHWQALFSYRPAFDVAVAVVRRTLPGRTRKIGQAAARRLRELDVNGSALKAADTAVCQAFATDRRAQKYLARLARARVAPQRAKGRFVAANLRLVISMARRYDHGLLPLADLIQEGNLGLIQAVERFDHRRGFRFSTYAAWWIRHSLNRALSDKARLVRVPVHALEMASLIRRSTGVISARTGAVPSLAELAVQTGLSERKLAQLRTEALTRPPISIDASVGDGGEQTLHDILQATDQPDPDHTLDLASWHQNLERSLSRLPPIEAAILRFRFGLDGGDELTLREIGDKYNLSRERIRQLQQQALSKLRETLRVNSEGGTRPPQSTESTPARGLLRRVPFPGAVDDIAAA